MRLSATLQIDGIAAPQVRLHNADADDHPYVFVEIGGSLSLYADDPAAFLRVADGLREAARQLAAAIGARAEATEPSDPDGEAFRGGEAAAYAREQIADAQRLK